MKLIDLLVRELPKQGGWPTASEGLALPLAGNDLVTSWRFNSELDLFVTCTYGSEVVTREEYEAALAASQKSAWNGDGLPPIGAKCRYRAFSDMPWVECEVLAWHANEVWLKRIEDGKTFTMGNPELFPMLTEAERKRKETAQEMCNLFGNGIRIDEKAGYGTTWLEVYHAIAAGKIPNITMK